MYTPGSRWLRIGRRAYVVSRINILSIVFAGQSKDDSIDRLSGSVWSYLCTCLREFCCLFLSLSGSLSWNGSPGSRSCCYSASEIISSQLTRLCTQQRVSILNGNKVCAVIWAYALLCSIKTHVFAKAYIDRKGAMITSASSSSLSS